MEFYLSQLAEHVYINYKDRLSKICIVFPNRRAGLFFQQYLAEKIDNPIWSPQILTIKEFVFEHTNLTQAENLKLLYELYKIYVKVKNSNENFDDFLPWGEIILRDFDELDKYLVNASELFKNISELKKIERDFNYLTEEQIIAITEFWKTFSNSKLSKNQDNFIYIWELLNKIYTAYKTRLTEIGIAYEGMIYRNVAEQIKEGKFHDKFNFDKILFVGFNAINNAEQVFLNYFKNKNIAEFYWDYDNYYVKSEHHEAGGFLRKNFNLFSKTDINISLDNFNSNKKINIISCPTDLMQANVLNKLLSDISTKTNNSNIKFNETAIVLADENLLIPVLYSIPNNFDDVNVTMGYPVRNTTAYGFVEILVDLALNSIVKNDSIQFYHLDVENLLSHNYTNYFDNNVNQVVDTIKNKNLNYINISFLTDLNIFKNADKLSKTAIELLEFIQEKLTHTFQSFDEKNYIEKEFVYSVYNELKKLHDIILLENLNIKKETFIRLLRKIIQLAKIPFAGEPLSGIQVLGILETRLLDFKNLIILSLNEDKFPPSSSVNSFIPYNLRKGFGMPTIEYGDAMYSYYFYRLIQRAENVFLLYNTDKSFESTGEMSRFLYQLKYESGLTIFEKDLNYDVEIKPNQEIIIKKADYKAKLELYLDSQKPKYLSPSSLNTYLDCSLKFYFRYIININEPEKVNEDLGADVFGNILHNTLENFYSQFVEKEITESVLNNWLNDDKLIDDEVLKSYKKLYSTDKPSGENIIIVETIKKYVKQIFRYDKSRLPFKVLSTEKSFNLNYNFVIDNETKNVNIGGKIDRVDLKNDTIQLIDYKSGKAEIEVKKGIDGLFSDEKKHRNHIALQMFLYSYIYAKTIELNLPISPCIFSVRELYKKDFDSRLKINGVPINNFTSYNQELENQLNNLLYEIFDVNTDFKQTTDLSICEYCAYNIICHRN